MRRIKLKKCNKYTIIDDIDYDLVSKYDWYLDSAGYALGTVNNKRIRLHRFLLQPNNKEQVDHKDQNKLNNRRNNLRICSQNENARNSKFRSHNTSGYRGVSLCKSTKKWRAEIRVNGKGIKLGRFYCKIDAARAYNAAAIKYHKEFAQLNKI